MAKCGESRRALFEANERSALATLPAHAWEWGEWVERKVGPNCHVRFERNHYSAPERHICRQVDVRAGERMVEVFLERGGERIAVHRRKAGRNEYATTPEHMPEILPLGFNVGAGGSRTSTTARHGRTVPAASGRRSTTGASRWRVSARSWWW